MSQTTSEPSRNEKVLFWASFMTLIAAGIGFSVRGAILKDWGQQFSFTQSELGTITGGGLLAFGVSIIFFSFFADLFGYGKLMLVAFLLHSSSAVITFAATPVYAAYGKEGAFLCLNIGMWLFALGNGTCEAVINPLTATLFPRNKTHWLNILHAGWPLGLVLGAVLTLGFGQLGEKIRWEIKLGTFMVPVLLYGLLMFNKTFPRSEAHASGVSLGTSFATLFAPVLLFLFLIHAMVGYVELGTDSWIVNITERVLGSSTEALLAFIWTNILMFTLRFFAGPIVHQISPLGLLFFSACLGSAGLYMLGQDFSSSTWPWIAAVTVYGIGKTFYWPTMLGVISERFPRGGALALGISGGIGMISAGLLGGPGIGYKQDYFSVEKIQATSPATYERYQARDDKGEPAKSGFPIVSQIAPDKAPPVAGIDNGKYKVIGDYQGVKKDPSKKIGLDEELDVLAAAEAKDPKSVEPKLKENLTAQKKWWTEQGLPNEEADFPKLEEAKMFGAKQALLVTAAVPATMAVCYLLLILFFKVTGGYKQEMI